MSLLFAVLPLLPASSIGSTVAGTLAEHLRQLSADEFFLFCQRNRELKFERRPDGTIELLPLSGGTTGQHKAQLTAQLANWNRHSRTGQVFASSPGFHLPSGAVRSPAAAWVRADVWHALTPEQQEKFPPICPDFVVELASPSDSLTDLAAKMLEYIENGCRLAWLIDPKTETARLSRANGSVSVVKSFDETLSGEDVLPGFSFVLSLLR